MLEHVDGWQQVLTAAARILRPGGVVYVSTLNRIAASRWLAVHLAEGLRLIPPGTHDPERLIRPSELTAAAEAAGLGTIRILGQRLRFMATLRHWAIRLAPGTSTALGYACWLERRA
jgi:2-polyprenyl-6-hydroxyphenyl methylase/3-demethylubiquinone-9 3-methyltransferase